MRSIGEAWQRAIDERYPLVTEFRSGCFVIHFLERPVSLEYDVQKTGQLLNPFVGFVRLTGKVIRNDEPTPSERYYKCFVSPRRGPPCWISPIGA
jgi:hypothetical protein